MPHDTDLIFFRGIPRIVIFSSAIVNVGLYQSVINVQYTINGYLGIMLVIFVIIHDVAKPISAPDKIYNFMFKKKNT